MLDTSELFQLIKDQNSTLFRDKLDSVQKEAEIKELDNARNEQGESLLLAAIGSRNNKIVSAILAKDVNLQEHDLCLMSDLPTNKVPNKGKIYFMQEGDKLKYTIIDPAGKHINGLLNIIVPDSLLTKEFLASKKSDILKEISERGHTNKTALNIIEEQRREIDLNEDQRLELNKIAALLRSRQEWQKELPPPFRFNMVIDLIGKSFSKIKPGNGRNKVLFIGATGSGKSTLINYLNGTRYKRSIKAGRNIINRIEGAKEVAKTGENIYSSETLYPQVVSKHGLGFVYCDLAGLFDSRGENQQIVAASSANVLIQTEGYIKGIIVLLDVPGFASEKGKAFKKTASAFSRIINGKPELMKSVQFAITKTEGPCEPQDVMDEYIIPLINDLACGVSRGVINPVIGYLNGTRLYNEQDFESHVEVLLKSLEGKLDYEELALLKILLHIRSQQIIVPDICDNGESCTLIEAKLNSLIQQRSGEFNFLSHDNSQECFNKALLTMVQGFLKRKDQIIKILPEKINEKKKLEEEENKKIDRWTQEIAELDSELNGQFNANRIVVSIKEKEAAIIDDEHTIEDQEAQNNARSNKIIDLSGKLGKLDNDDRIEVCKKIEDIPGKPHTYIMKHKSPYPLNRISYCDFIWYGTVSNKLIHPPETGETGIDHVDGTPCKFYEWGPDAINGIYEEEFHASEGISRLGIIFYATNRNIHKAEITELNKQKNDLEQSKYNSKQEIIRLRKEIERLKKDIEDAKIDIIKGEANFQIRKIELVRKKQDLEKLLEEAKTKRDSFITEQQKCSAAMDDNKMEIEVNQQLFETVYEITHILKLGNVHPDIPLFWEKFGTDNPEIVQTVSTSLSSRGLGISTTGIQQSSITTQFVGSNSISIRQQAQSDLDEGISSLHIEEKTERKPGLRLS